MAQFIPGGPKRFAHQRQGLLRLIETKGVCALLFDAGTGKTATTMDYLSLLALKSPRIVGGVPEARVLVISPKAAVDTWVLQAKTYISPQVNVWAEVLGGKIPQKAEAIASRAPEPKTARSYSRKVAFAQAPHRAVNADLSEVRYTRGLPPGAKLRGPNDLVGKPRLIILSTNLETLSSRARKGSKTMADVIYEAVAKYEPDAIVIDEMHKIKGPSSNMSRLAARLGKLTRRRIGLTGTVMPLGPMDVYAQWRFLAPTAFGYPNPRTGGRDPATLEQFMRRFGVLGGYMGREIIKYVNLDQLQEVMAENSMVVKKEDALDLPRMTDTVVPVVLSPRERKAYDDMKKDLATSSTQGTATAQNRLTQALRLRQITAGFLPDDSGNYMEIGSSKVDTITSLIHDTLEGEKRIVVFALYRHEIDKIAEKARREGTEVLVITGDTKDAQRLAYRRRFGSNDPARIVLVAQVQTISLSVNELVTASHAIYGTLSQRRDDHSQSRDRLNRIGQTKPCTFWHVQAQGTIDEVVFRSHQKRTDLESDILKHVQGITLDD